MRHIPLILSLWTLAYENEGDDKSKGGDDKTKGGDDKTKTFTQEDVNRLLSTNKRELKDQNEKMATELESFRKAKGLSDEERETLDSQIKALRNEKVSVEETLKRDLAKTKQERIDESKKLVEERDTWKSRYTGSTIRNSLIEAATTAKAYSPSQVVELLYSKTELVEEVDSDGKPSGNYVPKVKMSTTKDGKEITLTLSPTEALKQMKEDAESYGNLFVTDLKGGFGGSGGAGGNKGAPAGKHIVKKGDQKAYNELRKKGISTDDIIVQ